MKPRSCSETVRALNHDGVVKSFPTSGSTNTQCDVVQCPTYLAGRDCGQFDMTRAGQSSGMLLQCPSSVSVSENWDDGSNLPSMGVFGLRGIGGTIAGILT
jgi:hypothetical protein